MMVQSILLLLNNYMREIKFRAFDKWKWEWVYFGLIEVDGVGQDFPNGYAKIDFDK